MTIISARTESGEYIIEAKGHATGSEQVCAGISAIMYALAGVIQNRLVDGSYTISDSGEARCEFSGENAQAFYDMTVIGLKQIALSYPGFVGGDIISGL